MSKDIINLNFEKDEVTLNLTNLIKLAYNNDLVDHKEIVFGYHTANELYNRRRALVRLCTTKYPAFKSLKHHHDEYMKIPSDTFVVGFYTPHGPVAIHCKLNYLDEFAHLPFIEEAPLICKDHELSQKEKILRIRSLRKAIGNGKSIDEVINEIEHSAELEYDKKPSQAKIITNPEIPEYKPVEHERKIDLSSDFSHIIAKFKKAGLIEYKNLAFVWHNSAELLEFNLEFLCLFTALYPELSFVSLKHYDEENDPMHNGDFITGLYTEEGTIAEHFKLEYLNEFAHAPEIERGPKYDNYDDKDFMYRLNSLTTSIINGKSIEDIIADINNNIYFHESHKPKKNPELLLQPKTD